MSALNVLMITFPPFATGPTGPYQTLDLALLAQLVQHPPRPPEVQRAGMPVPNRFLARGSDVDVIEWQGDSMSFWR